MLKMLKVISNFLVSVVLSLGVSLCSNFCVVGQAHAASAVFEGRTIPLLTTANYCELGADTQYFQMTKMMLGKSVKLGAIVAPCEDIKALKSGTKHTLPHYLALMQIGIENNFVKFPLGTFVYVNLVSSFRANDLTKFENKVNLKLKPLNAKLTNSRYKLVQKTDKVVIYSAFGNFAYKDSSHEVSLLGLTTLSHTIPVAVYAFDEDPTDSKLKASFEELKLALSAF